MGLGLTIVVVGALTLLAWASFWGALASNVGMSRGMPASRGLAWGTMLGPIGLGVVVVRSRGGGKGLDGRKTAAMSAASKYGDKAKRSVAAWREPGTGDPPSWSAPPALPPADPVPSAAPVPPPTTWVPPPAQVPPPAPVPPTASAAPPSSWVPPPADPR